MLVLDFWGKSPKVNAWLMMLNQWAGCQYVFKPYESVLLGVRQDWIRNFTRVWPKISHPSRVFPDGYWHKGRPGWLWLVSPKLKSLFPHASLLTERLWREGGRDYKLISPHLSSPLLGYISFSAPLFAATKKGGASRIWHMKAFKLQSSAGELSFRLNEAGSK